MSGERAWVETVRADVENTLAGRDLIVETGRRLPYAIHVTGYHAMPGVDATPQLATHGYQTDLLIAERLLGSAAWVPRVVIEFKLGRVTTHDVLTYSAKAATHKNLHPYLRYGIVIGKFEGAVPRRLIRHGHHFDFMLTLGSEALTSGDRDRLIQLIREEVEASQKISAVLAGKSDVYLLHRQLVMAR